MDIKENLAQNLVKYRKNSNLTQLELAEKLNYSDKAVSKWERGESVPDLYALKQLADIFGVTIDTLIAEPKKEKVKTYKNISKKRFIISLSVTAFVWAIAVVYFACIGIIAPNTKRTWISFIYALPITFLIIIILTSAWGKTITRALALSLFVWTLILSVYLSLLFFIPYELERLWMLFLIGIPMQILIVLWLVYRKIK